MEIPEPARHFIPSRAHPYSVSHGRTELFMAARQLKLGAFMRPASIHTGAWRYPGAWPDMNFNIAHMRHCIQALERAKFDAFFMADHMAVLNMPVEALEAQPHGHVVRAVHAAVGALAGDREHRPGGDRLDHVRRALSHRAALRLARPSERRTRRLEHRHHVEPGCGAQFRHGRLDGARRALRARARILRRRHRPVGLVGGRCLHPRCRERHLPRSGQDARARPQGRVSVGARPAQHRAPDSGLAGHRAGRRIGGRQAARLRDGGSRVHRA